MPRKLTVEEIKKKKRIAAIRKSVRKMKPELRFQIPELPPKEGTLEYERMIHPFLPTSPKPNILSKSHSPSKNTVKLSPMKTGKSGKDDGSKTGRSTVSGTSDGSNTKKTFEDFFVPTIYDAETGKPLTLTRTMWSSVEGGITNDFDGLMNRGTGRLDLKSREDVSAYLVKSQTIVKPFQKGKGSPRKSFKELKNAPASLDSFSNSPRSSRSSRAGDTNSHSSTNRSSRNARTDKDLSHSAQHSEIVRVNTHDVKGRGSHHHKRFFHVEGDQNDHDNKKEEHVNYHAVSANKKTIGNMMQSHKAVHHSEFMTVDHNKEKHYNPMHHLHLDLHLKKGAHLNVHHHEGGQERGWHGGSQKKLIHHHAKRKMHPLVAKFMLQGPLNEKYHAYFDPKVDGKFLPDNYVNDEDDDAKSYLSYSDSSGSGSDNDGSGAAPRSTRHSARSTTSSLGFDSVEDNRKLKGKAKKIKEQGRRNSKSSNENNSPRPKNSEKTQDPMTNLDGRPLSPLFGGTPEAGMINVIGTQNLKDTEPGDDTSDDESDVSVLSDALDPENEISWKALEDRIYADISKYAIDYEVNKSWTAEKAYPGGAPAMDVAIRKFANWKARCTKFIVQAVDDEKERDDVRIALEDELEINKPEKLLEQVKLHKEERHKFRTYIQTFKYDMEILEVHKLSDMGLIW
jgi:hypothetical protein